MVGSSRSVPNPWSMLSKHFNDLENMTIENIQCSKQQYFPVITVLQIRFLANVPSSSTCYCTLAIYLSHHIISESE